MARDFIIVGAGTAGCVMARGLSDMGLKVTLLEAGGGHRHPHVQIPAAFPKLFKSSRDWAFETAPQPQLDGRRIFWPRGKMLGGSSSMNAQIHHACACDDFEKWAESGARNWGPDVMGPALQSIDAALNGGPLAEPNPLTHAFLESAERAGLRRGRRLNDWREKQGVWIAEVAHRAGARRSAADAFLTPTHFIEIRKHAHVRRILFDGVRASGVEARIKGRLERLEARRGVILCAGAIGSPHLLMLSGVGPAAALSAHGVPVVRDSKMVGANLQDHLMFVMHFRSKRPLSLRSAESPANLWRYVVARKGMLASNVAEAMALFPSKPGGPVDLEIVFAPALFENEGLSPPSAHGFSLAPVLLAPKSRGRIALASASPEAAPTIDPAYLSDEGGADLVRLKAAATVALDIAAQAPLAAETSRRLWPRAVEEDALAGAIRASAHTIYHPVGTCRMGDDAQSVVDCGLKVRGVDGVWVADASVMPTIPSGHPNAVVAAIAHVGAQRIAGARL